MPYPNNSIFRQGYARVVLMNSTHVDLQLNAGLALLTDWETKPLPYAYRGTGIFGEDIAIRADQIVYIEINTPESVKNEIVEDELYRSGDREPWQRG